MIRAIQAGRIQHIKILCRHELRSRLNAVLWISWCYSINYQHKSLFDHGLFEAEKAFVNGICLRHCLGNDNGRCDCLRYNFTVVSKWHWFPVAYTLHPSPYRRTVFAYDVYIPQTHLSARIIILQIPRPCTGSCVIHTRAHPPRSPNNPSHDNTLFTIHWQFSGQELSQ